MQSVNRAKDKGVSILAFILFLGRTKNWEDIEKKMCQKQLIWKFSLGPKWDHLPIFFKWKRPTKTIRSPGSSVRPSIYLSVFVCLAIHLSDNPSLSVCLSVFLSVCQELYHLIEMSVLGPIYLRPYCYKAFSVFFEDIMIVKDFDRISTSEIVDIYWGFVFLLNYWGANIIDEPLKIIS